MSENNTDPRADRSRRALLDAAIELMLESPNASISDVATHAGVGRATLYRHFKTRDDLVRAAALESMQVTEEILQPLRDNQALSARDTLEAGVRGIMPVADRFHFLLLLWNIAETDTEVMEIYSRQLKKLSELVERGKREKSIEKQLPTSWVVSLVDCVVYVGWWAVRSGEISAKQAGNHAVFTLFNGIGNSSNV